MQSAVVMPSVPHSSSSAPPLLTPVRMRSTQSVPESASCARPAKSANAGTNTTTGGVFRFCSVSASSIPERPGMVMSKNSTSGLFDRIDSTASVTLPASAI